MVQELRCPQCGSTDLETAEGGQARSCKSCGEPLAKHCPRCGTRLELRMRFCDQCGANYAELSAPDGHCHWCGSMNSTDAELCASCGARLITTCPRCDARMKSGLNHCAVCGLDYEELIQDQEDEESGQPDERL